jgi:uncharacterized protein YhaN
MQLSRSRLGSPRARVMRFAELRLLKYGRFDGCRLEFSATEPDLQIILGENEVGKSTTLEAVGDLLFGFPHVTPFDFRFDRQLLRVGAILEADDHTRLECRRKKGNVSTLLSEDESPIDEGRLTALLHGQSRDSFYRMFSLDHRRLREGGQAILDAKDDVGRAIFAAGSGLVGITRLLDDQVLAAKSVWAPRARDAAFTNAQRAFDEAKARLRERRPHSWVGSSQRLHHPGKTGSPGEPLAPGFGQRGRAVERAGELAGDGSRGVGVLAEIRGK